MKSVQPLCVFLLIVVVRVAVSAQNASSSLDPFSISISVADDQISLGSPIKINIVLENISDKEITVAQSNFLKRGERSYRINVVSATDTIVPMTDYGNALADQPTKSFTIVRDSQQPHFLQPHEKLAAEVTLNHIYKFVTPGTFFVQAVKDINPDVVNSGVVKSNILTLNVVQNSACNNEDSLRIALRLQVHQNAL